LIFRDYNNKFLVIILAKHCSSENNKKSLPLRKGSETIILVVEKFVNQENEVAREAVLHSY